MGDVCYRLQRVPDRASGIGQAGFLANRWIAPFSPRDERVACVARLGASVLTGYRLRRYCTHSTTSVPVGKRRRCASALRGNAGRMQGAFARGAMQRLRKKETLSPFGLRVSG